MKDEIEAGIRNALARGVSLEDAVQSFLNAGYNPREVNEAEQNIRQGASSALAAPVMPVVQQSKPIAKKQDVQTTTQPQPPQRAQVVQNLQKAPQSPQPIVRQLPAQPLQAKQFPVVQRNMPVQPAKGPTVVQQLPRPEIQNVPRAPQTIGVSSLPQHMQSSSTLLGAPVAQSSVQSSARGKIIFLIVLSLVLIVLVIAGLIFNKAVISFLDSLFA